MYKQCSMSILRFLALFTFYALAIGVEGKPQKRDQIRSATGDFAYPDSLDTWNYGGRQNDYFQHHHHHHHPYHDPDFHHHHHNENDPDRPEDTSRGNSSGKLSTLEIPLDFAHELNTHNVTDLLLNYVEDGAAFLDEDEHVSFSDRFSGGSDSQERRAIVPKGAPCIPELSTVRIASDDVDIFYIPECTRIERCGGCCSHFLLSCQPQEVEIVNYKVFKTQYTGASNKFKPVSKEIVPVERHTKCKCDCRIKAKDCNSYQEYKPKECRCVCKNTDEEKKCYKQNGSKVWNSDVCACQCRESMTCSTGTYFDQNECKCAMAPVKRRFANYERRTRSEPLLSVVPLPED